MKWIKDEEFIRAKVPMTKFDVRAAIMAALAIEAGETFIDVGAGTGSISVQAAIFGAEVYAVEEKEAAVELIIRNSEKFEVKINVSRGTAPEALKDIPSLDKCFIGGSRGRLRGIFEALNSKLRAGGVFAATFITLKNITEFQELMKEFGYKEQEIKLFQISVMDELGLMKANNPIFLVKGVKP